MNNEEKILGLLEKMDERLINLEQGQVTMQTDIAGLKQGQLTLETDLRKLNQTVAVIEVEHGKKLNALMDGNKDLNRKADTLQATVDDMAPTVTALDVLHQMRGNK